MGTGICSISLRTGRPWVRIKSAASLDGRTALADGTSQWITGEAARRDVHALRARSCAMLTGIGTVLRDDPELTVRHVPCSRQPRRVLIDSRLDLAPTAKILQGEAPIIFTVSKDAVKRSRLMQAGAEVISEDELMGNVALLASGAAESTRTALSHGMHELMRNPEQMAYLREHADDIPATAIQEIVRIATPFTHLCRTATADHELHGKEIKENDKVLMLFAAGNFDERAIDDPNTFDLSREKNPHVSFGRGPHQSTSLDGSFASRQCRNASSVAPWR